MEWVVVAALIVGAVIMLVGVAFGSSIASTVHKEDKK